MRILQATNKNDRLVLTSPSKSVEDVSSDNAKRWIQTLFQVTVASKCLGLSLPQIGINRRIIAIKRANKKEILILVNPIIVEESGTVHFKEGCLSIPGFNVKVRRKRNIVVEYQDMSGNTHILDFDGVEAICIQHEIDHLDGILMTKHGMPFKARS